MTDSESHSDSVRNQATSDDPPYTQLDPGDIRRSDFLKHRWFALGGVAAVGPA